MSTIPFARALAALALTLAATLAGGRPLAAQDDLRALWRDPTFQKQFVGSYGINAEIEPRVTPEEVEVLEKVRPLMADDLPRAQKTLEKEMEDDGSAMLDFTLGGIRFQRDDLAGARRSYELAVHKFPSFRRAWRNLGLVHVREGRHDDAIRAFTRMVELGGGDGYSFGLLGWAYAAKEDYQAAEAAYRNALLLQPDSTEWRLGLTRCVVEQEKFQDAATLLDALIARYPEKAEFWLLQAHTFVGMQRPLRAAENFEIVDRLGAATAEQLHTLGDLYVGEGLPDLAADAYRRALERDPAQPLERPLRAVETLAARGALERARELAARVRETRGAELADGERTRLLKLEARLALADGGGGGDDAARVLEEIVALDPLDGEALLLLGQHHARAGRPDHAILCYERAESVAAFEVDARVRHAQVLVGMGRYVDALPLLRRAQELRPREDVGRYLESVERFAKAKR